MAANQPDPPMTYQPPQQQTYNPNFQNHQNHQNHQNQQVWNLPPQQQGVPYVQYQQPEMGQYGEKPQFSNYQHMHFSGPMDADMMRQQHFTNGQFVPHPQHFGYHQQGQSNFIPTYATSFNAVTDPAYQAGHPMNRNNFKRDDYNGTVFFPASSQNFQDVPAPIGVIDNQAHASASANYTANWVSSTSSIPPEMRDEPENDVTYERNAEGQLTDAVEEQKSEKPEQKKEKVDKRELTFDERLEKARMQKTRVENEGVDSGNGESSPQSLPTPTVSSNRGGRSERGQRGNSSTRGAPHNGERRPNNYNYNREAPREQGFQQQGQQQGPQQTTYYGGRGRGGRGGYQNNQGQMMQAPHGGPPMGYQQQQFFAPQQAPQQFLQYQPMPHPGMDPNVLATINALQNHHIGFNGGNPYVRGPLLPGPFGVPLRAPIPQDPKFRNTWLDAGYQSPMTMNSMMHMDQRGRGGYRGRGGRGGQFARGGGVGNYNNGGQQYRRYQQGERRDDQSNNGEQARKDLGPEPKIDTFEISDVAVPAAVVEEKKETVEKEKKVVAEPEKVVEKETVAAPEAEKTSESLGSEEENVEKPAEVKENSQ